MKSKKVIQRKAKHTGRSKVKESATKSETTRLMEEAWRLLPIDRRLSQALMERAQAFRKFDKPPVIVGGFLFI